jgi:hypothetical protein
MNKSNKKKLKTNLLIARLKRDTFHKKVKKNMRRAVNDKKEFHKNY